MKKPPRTGWIIAFPIAGTYVVLHWSFPLVGSLLAAFIAWLASYPSRGLEVPYFFYISTWGLVLVVIHELGHAVAAKVVGAKVQAIAIAGTGGWCALSKDRLPPTRALLVYAGGLFAQLFTFLVAVAALYKLGPPHQVWSASAAIVFTAGNAVLFLGNALPRGENDGARLRDTLRQLRAGDA